ncbi:MAG: hypothetical protein IKK43_03870 [Clostridia bacterium]|nr:hypothetical protein [Clostridia bacterium]
MYYHAEEYSVCIKYDGKEFCRDDEKLYKSVEVGDEVRVLVHKGYNKHNKLKHIYLS